MNDYKILIGLFVIIYVVSIFIIIRKNNKPPKKERTNNIKITQTDWNFPETIKATQAIQDTTHTQDESINSHNNYSQSYQKKHLLTKNEYHEYKKLRYYAEKHDFLVCPKVRLLDLVEPRRGEGFMSALGKIQSKHVDFVICDQNLYVKGIVEIDDNSHNRQDRQQRDLFVDEVLTSVGYTVIRTRAVTEETLKPILPVHTANTETEYFGQDPAQADTHPHQ